MSWTTLYLGSLRNATDHVWIMLRICSFTGSGLDWHKKVQWDVALHMTPIVISWLFVNYLFINLLHVHLHLNHLRSLQSDWLSAVRFIHNLFAFLWNSTLSRSINTKKELGQYPTILTSRFVNHVYVLVNFLISGNFCFFCFVLFLGMVMYDNEVETKEKYKLAEIKKY